MNQVVLLDTGPLGLVTNPKLTRELVPLVTAAYREPLWRTFMARIEIGQHLAIDTRVCGGRLIFKGTRILVSDVLELLRANFTAEQIVREYQGLIAPEAVREAFMFNRRGIVREVLPKTKTAA